MEVKQIAELCHEANRVYCRLIGDDSQVPWRDAPGCQVDSAVARVKFRLENPNAPASHQHDEWLETKRKQGWKCGPVKDAEKKEHPCIVPYDELPLEQRLKDTLFGSIVDVFKTGFVVEYIDGDIQYNFIAGTTSFTLDGNTE